MSAIEQSRQTDTNSMLFLDQTVETTDIDCDRCGQVFALVVKVDAFGNRTVHYGEQIRGRWTCSECIPAAVEEWAADLAAERAAAGPYWFPMDERAKETMEIAELAEQGFYDAAPTEAPDVDPGDIPQRGADGEWS